jgi:hypothetical protein
MSPPWRVFILAEFEAAVKRDEVEGCIPDFRRVFKASILSSRNEIKAYRRVRLGNDSRPTRTPRYDFRSAPITRDASPKIGTEVKVKKLRIVGTEINQSRYGTIVLATDFQL